MEPPAALRVLPTEGAGELVLENGPQCGLRRALIGPLTFIGQTEWCDLRVDAESVSPWHCVVARGEAGLVLRDLHSDTGTVVNGQAVTTCSLQDGDLLTVGPLRLRVRWEPQNASALAEQERPVAEAAALAAEQAEKRRQLEELRDTILKERAALHQDRQRFEERVAQVQQDLARDRLAMAERQKALREQTEHLGQLRRRAGERWRRHWTAERARFQAAEAALSEERRVLEAERTHFHQDRLRFNGEAELGRRQLQAAWHDFRREQQTRAERTAQREKAVRRRELAVADADGRLAREVGHWEKARGHCQQEIAGLENRVQNYRRKIRELEQEAARLESRRRETPDREQPAREEVLPAAPRGSTITPPAPQPPVAEDLEERLTALEVLAGELADQRLHIAEQCEHLARAREECRQEREGLAAELEALAHRLNEREQAVQEQQRAALTLEDELGQRRADLERARRQTDAEQIHFSVQRAEWEAKRDCLLADVRAREERLEDSLQGLAALRERWQAQCQEELAQLQAERAACAEARLQHATLRQDNWRRRATLEQQQRALAARTLALEQFRLDGAEKTPDSVALQRLEKLRRRWGRLQDRAAQAVALERQLMLGEASRIEELAQRLHERADTLAIRETDLTRRQAAWEHLQATLATENARLRQQVDSLGRQRLRHVSRVAELQGEVEHLAGILLDAPVEAAPRLVQAA